MPIFIILAGFLPRFQELQKTEHALIIDNLDNVFKSVDITYIDKMLHYNRDCSERRPLRD